MNLVEKSGIKTAPVSDEEINFLAVIFEELIRKENAAHEQNNSDDETV